MSEIKNLSIDIETYSSVNLAKSGVYRYVEAKDFEILLFGYSTDGSEVKVIDLASGEALPKEILEALTDTEVTKWAFNAQFERVCLSSYLGLPTGKYLDPSQWRCSMVWSAYMGLPLSLEGSGAVLGLEKQKLQEGKDLIRYFCVPCKPTKTNGGRTRNLPTDASDKWERFKAYNQRDVETELEIKKKLERFPVPEFVWGEYHLDQEINDRGILVDMPFVREAVRIDSLSREELIAQMRKLTDLENPNSVLQMKTWLSDKGLEIDSLGKKEVKAMLGDTEGEVSEALMLRLQLAKSSVKKYQAMESAVCSDDRARGMFQFYGANRTGRFSSHIIQWQNLARNEMSDLDQARSLVRSGDIEALTLLYDDIPDVLSQLVRTAFISKQDYKFFVADFSAIEARVLAWLSGEHWVLEVFASGGDIYCETASRMFHVPVVKHGINGELRQKGKQAVLSCGYSGGVGALKAMGAIEAGMKEEELQPLVDAWRAANPNIVRFWWKVDAAVKKALKDRTYQEVNGIGFSYRSGMLFVKLPSGRSLAYVKPRLETNRFGGESMTYEGIGATKKWERLESFSGRMVENITQAIARDLLLNSMKNLKDLAIVAHVHDELIIEAPAETDLKEICEKMAITPIWAEGLVLRADGYVCDFYKKD